MDTDDRPPKKYALVRADNNDMFLVAKDINPVPVTQAQKSQIESILYAPQAAEDKVSLMFEGPLG